MVGSVVVYAIFQPLANENTHQLGLKAILWWVKVRKGQCGGYAKVRLALVTCGEVRDWFAALEPDREGIAQTSCPRDLATEPSDEEFVSFL